MENPFLTLRRALGILAAAVCATPHAQTISPMLMGNNAWYQPNAKMWELAEQAGVRSIRIGGAAYDGHPLSKETLLAWVEIIQKMGAIPIVQVSKEQTPAEVAELVRYLNKEKARNVRYWNIGNESWLEWGRPKDLEATAARIAAFWKPLASAMKRVDPTILIYGFDEAHALSPVDNIGPNPTITSLLGGKNDISGKDADGHYYVDGYVWHHYAQAQPGEDGINLPYEGFEGYRVRALSSLEVIAAANRKAGRAGANALRWAIGEFNATGKFGGVPTWGNGQMFALILNEAMKHGATYAAAWSLMEGGSAGGLTDYGWLGAEYRPRSSYWHHSLIARSFSGEYAKGSASDSNAVAFGYRNGKEAGAMILNRGAKGYRYGIRFDGTPGTGDLAIAIDAGVAYQYRDTIGPRETQLLVFGPAGSRKTVYSRQDARDQRPPRETALPPVELPAGMRKAAEAAPIAQAFAAPGGREWIVRFPGVAWHRAEWISPSGTVLARAEGEGSELRLRAPARAGIHFIRAGTRNTAVTLRRVGHAEP